MKKIITFVVVFLVIIAATFGTLYVIDSIKMRNNEEVLFSTWGKNYSPIKPELKAAIDDVFNYFAPKTVKSIINKDNPIIEECVFNEQPYLHFVKEEFNIVGRELFKITFTTTHDGILGPMVVYVGKETCEFIAYRMRN